MNLTTDTPIHFSRWRAFATEGPEPGYTFKIPHKSHSLCGAMWKNLMNTRCNVNSWNLLWVKGTGSIENIITVLLVS